MGQTLYMGASLRSKVLCGTALCFVSAVVASVAPAEPLRLRNGITGLVDAPSAFHQPDAETGVSLTFDADVRSAALAFQTLPWLETSLSFTTFRDVGGGLSEDNVALNLKARLLEEGPYRPALSIGIDDLFSNTRESAEYIVASKTLGRDFRASVGLGWGRLGGYDNAADAALDRPAPVGGAQFELSHLFRGNAAAFAGLEWDTPLEGLTLATEYSSATAYGDAARPASQFNFAASYEVADGIRLIAYHRQGTTTGVTLSFHANPKSPPQPPDVGGAAPLIQMRPVEGRGIVGWADNGPIEGAVRQALSERLEDQSIKLERFAANGRTMSVGVVALDNSPVAKVVGRTARVLSQVAPPSVEEFEITSFAGGFPGTVFRVPRDAFAEISDQPGRLASSLNLVDFEGAPVSETKWEWVAPFEGGFSWSITPTLSLPLGQGGELDPEVNVFADAKYSVSPNFYVAGTLSYLVAGDKTIDPAPAIPTPRSDGGSYDRTSVRLDRLYGAYRAKLSPTTYGSLTFGLLESEYRGVSAEAAWIPDHANWALGAELTYAEKRDYSDPFGRIGFDAVTGFVSVYWDTGFEGIGAQVDAGRYLAGDWGSTLTLSRSFANGWDVRAYTTLTEDNGDENLKLGASVSIPLAAFGQVNSQRRNVLSLGGNFGDAGTRVSVPDPLMARVRETRSQRIEDGWSEFWN